MDRIKLDATLEDKFVSFVREAIDLMVQGAEDEFPAMADVIAKSGIATHKQLEALEGLGHIKSVTAEVPSRLVPGRTVPAKAYYTERRVPKLVEAMLPKKASFEVFKERDNILHKMRKQ